jgi:hypothetical protein
MVRSRSVSRSPYAISARALSMWPVRRGSGNAVAVARPSNFRRLRMTGRLEMESTTKLKGLRRTNIVVAVIIVVFLLLLIYSYVYIPMRPKPMYANIDIMEFESPTVANPTIRLSVDTNNDGTNEVQKVYTMQTTQIAGQYLSLNSILENNIELDRSATNWTFTVQILNGTIPVHFDDDKDYVTYVCAMADRATGDFMYAPTDTPPSECVFHITYIVLSEVTTG